MFSVSNRKSFFNASRRGLCRDPSALKGLVENFFAKEFFELFIARFSALSMKRSIILCSL